VRDARWNPLREPLVHFALGALLILGVDRAVTRARPVVAPARPRIVVDAAALAGLRARFESQSFHRVTPDEERALVDEYVRDEALAREARALHLDEGDAVIRRRLVQKMELVLDGQSVPEPAEAELTRWLDAHAAEFQRAPTVSFEHVYFARSTRGDRAEPDARAALAAMDPNEPLDRALTRGEPFVRGHSMTSARFAEVTAALGYELARALDGQPLGRWSGPVDGAHGWHLVRVTARDPGGPATLDAVRAEVRRRWSDERRAALAREATARIVGRYEIVR
jgi:peptidyl-prolyl cis-trans isomerase C